MPEITLSENMASEPGVGELVTIDDGGVATTTSLLIAQGTGHEHASVIRLVRDNLGDLQDFGRVGFEIRPFATAGGIQRREVAILGEEHATLLLTYMRNNQVVREFKKRLVREFWVLRRRMGVCEVPRTLPAALRLAADQVERAELAESRVAALDAKVAADAEKVAYVEQYVADDDLLSLRTVAANNNVGERWLRDLLIGRAWIYMQSEQRWSQLRAAMNYGADTALTDLNAGVLARWRCIRRRGFGARLCTP
ncbi:Rha family transcriptional regulator [Mycobacteroides abscessus]|uniref:Rha family transcriptional regulator n=1 Tax=Mycobacteroides abscessus TaxID=36809 RepID=UPI001F1DF605|nr:Rha family transcriptional regulator [Mycobacteroides abscessus]